LKRGSGTSPSVGKTAQPFIEQEIAVGRKGGRGKGSSGYIRCLNAQGLRESKSC